MFSIDAGQRAAFRTIFLLKAPDGKLTKDGLAEVFKAIDYKCSEK
jgi:hypothetical protein